MRIFIVDDSRAMRLMVRRALRQAGIDCGDVVEAGSGEEALALMADKEPDLVMSDWNMPGMTGLDLLKAARQRGVSAKFGFVTSERPEHLAAEASSAGASFFVTKPFTPETLGAALSRHVGG